MEEKFDIRVIVLVDFKNVSVKGLEVDQWMINVELE